MNVAIVGATGAVGQLVCRIIEQRNLRFDNLRLIASARSAGTTISVCGQAVKVEELSPDSFDKVDLVIGSTPDEIAVEFVPWALASGAVVIDESGAHRMRDDVPLIIPEVNPDAIEGHSGLVASPNCSTTQMALALQPLHRFGRVTRVIVTTYQATSGAGQGGSQELLDTTRSTLDGNPAIGKTFSHPIAFNLIPQIGSARTDNYTSEELKMVFETQKIFADDTIRICPTCVRVPVMNCHSESMVVETERPISPEQARELFAASDGMALLDDLANQSYPMPINADGQDEVFVGRIRRDLSRDNSLAFWCVSDNLRKGAATNAVQIAELLIARRAIPCLT